MINSQYFLLLNKENVWYTNNINRNQQIQSDWMYTSDYESIKLYYSDKIYASLAYGFRYTVNECKFKINTLKVYHIKSDARYKRFHSPEENLSYSRWKTIFSYSIKLAVKVRIMCIRWNLSSSYLYSKRYV